MRETLLCIRCAACLNVCPVYNHVGGHAYGWVYSGPIGAILSPQLLGTRVARELPFASTLCGACADLCPVKIPIPKILLGLRQRVAEGDAGQGPSVTQATRLGAKVSARVLEKPWLYRLGSKLLRATQKSFRHGDWLATVFPPLYRWTKVRPLPAFAADFREWWKVRQSHIPNGKIQVSEPGKQVPIDNSQLPVAQPELSLKELVEQVNRLAGHGEHVNAASLDAALGRLVETEGIKKANLWATDDLTRLQIAARLSALGVTIISHDAPQNELAQVDLGITEADFCLPDTGSLGLLASPEKRRAISLLPRVHLAIVRSSALRRDLQQVLDECKSQQHLVIITGPSRTSDIESEPVIGAHGPPALYVWAME